MDNLLVCEQFLSPGEGLVANIALVTVRVARARSWRTTAAILMTPAVDSESVEDNLVVA